MTRRFRDESSWWCHRGTPVRHNPISESLVRDEDAVTSTAARRCRTVGDEDSYEIRDEDAGEIRD